MAKRLILCVRDTDRENDVRPLRMRNGRLLVRLVADPAAADIVKQTRRATLPLGETVILGGAESEANEEIQEIKGAGSIWELEIVDGLDGITGFTNHSARHEDGGDDEIDVTDLSGLLADPQTPLAHKTSHQDGGSDEIEVTALSGKLADPQPTDLKSEGYARVYFWLGAA